LCIIRHTQNRFLNCCWARLARVRQSQRNSRKIKKEERSRQGQVRTRKVKEEQGRLRKSKREQEKPRKDKQGHKKGIRKPVKLPCLAISPGLKGTGDDALDSVDKEEKPAIHNREALEQ
jgi:hypothetical protein